MCDVGTEANSVTRWLVNFFSSIFGHLQQIKIAKQQNLAETKIFLQMLHKHLKIGSKDLAKSGCIEGDESS